MIITLDQLKKRIQEFQDFVLCKNEIELLKSFTNIGDFIFNERAHKKM